MCTLRKPTSALSPGLPYQPPQKIPHDAGFFGALDATIMLPMRRRLVYSQLIVAALLALLYIYFGLDKEYLWTVYWWDIPLHMLGGAWNGFAAAWGMLLMGQRPKLIHCLIVALIVGIVWEVFEYINHIGGSVFMPYWVDTIKDIADDLIGACIARLSLSWIRRV